MEPQKCKHPKSQRANCDLGCLTHQVPGIQWAQLEFSHAPSLACFMNTYTCSTMHHSARAICRSLSFPHIILPVDHIRLPLHEGLTLPPHIMTHGSPKVREPARNWQ